MVLPATERQPHTHRIHHDMRLLSWCGIAGPALRVGVPLALGALQTGYAPMHDAVSLLGARGAPHAAIMNAAGFLAAGLLIASFALALPRTLRPGRLATAAAALLALHGLATAGIAFAPCDPGCPTTDLSPTARAHAPLAILMMLSGALAPLLVALHQRAGTDDERRHAITSLALGAVALVAIVTAIVRGGPEAPFFGLVQRISIVATSLWVMATAARALRRAAPLPHAEAAR